MRWQAWLAAYPAQFTVFLLALCATCFAVFALASWQSAHQHHAVALEEQRTQQTHAQRAAGRERMEAVIAPYAGNLEQLRGKLGNELKEGALLSAFQTLARSSNTRLVNFRMEERPQQGAFRVRVAYIELRGTYAAVRRFITDVEKLPMAAIVGNAILEKDLNGNKQIKATLEVIGFAQGDAGAER